MERLVVALDEYARDRSSEEVIIQAGVACDVVHYATAVSFAADAQIQRWTREARIIVSHGGPTLLLGLVDAGLVPVVMPREHRFGEHVDDHQLRFASFLADRQLIILVRSGAELKVALDRFDEHTPAAVPLEPADASRATALIDQLVTELFQSARERRQRAKVT